MLRRFFLVLSFLFLQTGSLVSAQNLDLEQLKATASKIQEEPFRAWPLLHNGRLKPFESMARESLLFLTGSYSFAGIPAIPLYFSILNSPTASDIPMLEIRSPDLREKIGFRRDQRFVSAKELEKSPLPALAQPLLEKQMKNRRELNELESKTLEAFEQLMVFQQISQGTQLMSALDPEPTEITGHTQSIEGDPKSVGLLQSVVASIHSGVAAEQALSGHEMQTYLQTKAFNSEIDHQKKLISYELLYNQTKPFRWACWIYFFLALFFFSQKIHKTGGPRLWVGLSLLPLLIGAFGFYLRISITGFAPVTNMFGTMLWVSFGLSIFSVLLLAIYKDPLLSALLSLGSFALLLLTESIPLILSPDLDPIVAVLRSNLWLTIHVLTITVSYAAFSISMILGNTTLIQYLLGRMKSETLNRFSHYCYRSIQLGVLLITAGIILGGIWADYSWGRFWGWDPKETWALIADLGYISILHARYAGWVSPFRMMLLAPLSYLLVVMAWYGVNFILATGLHSYGFSSGGAFIVAIYVLIQLTLIGAALLKQKMSAAKAL